MHLSDYMARLGLSDEDVAKQINRSRATVSRYRRRVIRPDWQTIERIKEWSHSAVCAEDWMDLREDQEEQCA